MKIRSILEITCGLVFMLLGVAANVQAGAVHDEYEMEIPDEYIDCTDEGGTWYLMVSDVSVGHETPSGNEHSVWHANWEGVLEGEDTGYEWYTKGILQLVNRYSLKGEPVGMYMQVENSVLKPMVPEAPRMLLDVLIQTTYNANGELVVDKFTYALNCLGKKK